MSDITLGLATGDDDATREAAGVWARARAHRDGGEVDVRRAHGAVRGRLLMAGAQLVVALDGADVVGFAVTVPQDDDGEVFFLAVDPSAQGRGVGARLLAAAEALAGRTSLRLWVIEDNVPAIGLYEAAGWTRSDETQVREDGRTEVRYRKQV